MRVCVLVIAFLVGGNCVMQIWVTLEKACNFFTQSFVEPRIFFFTFNINYCTKLFQAIFFNIINSLLTFIIYAIIIIAASLSRVFVNSRQSVPDLLRTTREQVCKRSSRPLYFRVEEPPVSPIA